MQAGVTGSQYLGAPLHEGLMHARFLGQKRLTKAGVLGCRTSPKRSGTPSMGLTQEALRGLAPSSDWISAAAVGVLGIGDACAGGCKGHNIAHESTRRDTSSLLRPSHCCP